jgi:hypothetical protein
MKKGFMRIVEVSIALILLLMLSTTLLQRDTPIPQSTKNTRMLQRYAEDMKNMICSSEKDNILLLTGDDLSYINQSLNYVSAPGMKFNVVVFQDNDVIVKQVGYGLPDLAEEKVDVATSSCMLSNETQDMRTVVVQTWY